LSNIAAESLLQTEVKSQKGLFQAELNGDGGVWSVDCAVPPKQKCNTAGRPLCFQISRAASKLSFNPLFMQSSQALRANSDIEFPF